MSLRLRLTITYGVLLALILAGLGTVLYGSMRLALQAEMDRRLEVRASQVELTIWPGTQSLTYDDLTSARLDLSPLDSLRAPGLFVQVLNPAGSVVASSSNLQGAPPLTDHDSLTASLSGKRVLSDVVEEEGRVLRVLNIPISIAGNVVGVLAIGQSRQPLQETMETLLKQLLLLGAAALGLTGLVGSFVAQRGLEPLSTMARRAAAITARRDFTERLQLTGPRDEVRRLAETIDQLLTTVDATLAQHRAFVADTSHELRNPLLALRTNLELLDRLSDAADRAECIREANIQVERMSRLVSDLLLLARVEATQMIERKPVALESILERTLRIAQQRASGQVLGVSVVEPAEVLGDEARLEQVLVNLVDNALAHTPPGHAVTLGLEREDGWAKLTVSDTGEGIPLESLPHVFERFYRVDRGPAAREGTGLGLAIVKHLTEAHGGRVSAESEPGKGSRFIVWLRVLTAQPS